MLFGNLHLKPSDINEQFIKREKNINCRPNSTRIASGQTGLVAHKLLQLASKSCLFSTVFVYPFPFFFKLAFICFLYLKHLGSIFIILCHNIPNCIIARSILSQVPSVYAKCHHFQFSMFIILSKRNKFISFPA